MQYTYGTRESYPILDVDQCDNTAGALGDFQLLRQAT